MPLDAFVCPSVALRPLNRRVLLAGALGLVLPAVAWAQEKSLQPSQDKSLDKAPDKVQGRAGRARSQAPAPVGAGPRWWVELRIASEEAALSAGAVRYRSEPRAAEPLMQLQLAQGERASFVLEQVQPWVWTDAVWAPAAPASAASAPAAAASSPTAGGVLQSLQWRRQVQALECEMLSAAPRRSGAAPAAQPLVGLRLRLVWSGAASGAAQVLDAPQGSERVGLEAELYLPTQRWVLLARSGVVPGSLDEGGAAPARHYGAGVPDAAVPVARALYLRVRAVEP